jgi:hypothetical protein
VALGASSGVGVIALPLWARMYVRVKDLPAIYPQHRPEFQTKLEMAVALLRSAHCWLTHLGKSPWVLVDWAYAKAPFLKRAMALEMTVLSRLRKDAPLWTVPGPRMASRPGRPRIYGENRIELAKRAGQRRSWMTAVFELYGKHGCAAMGRSKSTPEPAVERRCHQLLPTETSAVLRRSQHKSDSTPCRADTHCCGTSVRAIEESAIPVSTQSQVECGQLLYHFFSKIVKTRVIVDFHGETDVTVSHKQLADRWIDFGHAQMSA